MAINPQDIIISKFLPHKPPLLLVDNLLELSHKHVKTQYKIKEPNCFLFNNILSEFGLIEHAAQTCSAVVGHSFFFDEQGKELTAEKKVIGFINSVKNITLHQLPKLNEIVTTTATLISKVETDSFIICILKSNTSIKEKLALEAEFNLIISEKL